MHPDHPDISQFSKREMEVTELLLQGKSNKQIALSLGISASTVEYHLKNIYKKLKVGSRTEAVLRLGKSIGGSLATESGKSIVEINGESTENGEKSISMRRFPMNKMFYLIGGGLLTIVVFVIVVLANVLEQNVEIVPTVQASMVPVHTAIPTVNLNLTEITGVNPISITEVIDTGDSYILMGEFIPELGTVLSDSCCNLDLLDGNGKVIVAEMPMDIDPRTPTVNTPFSFTWVRKFEKVSVVLPVTVKVEDVHWSSLSVPFEFDAGDQPQVGDAWQVNQPFEVSGTTFTLETIRVISPQMPQADGGYAFLFTYPSDHNVIALDEVSIEGHPLPINSGFGGGGSSAEPVPTQNGIDFSVEFTSLPKGKLTIKFTFMVASAGQQWTLPWHP
jgi:DNA-binding CsgD family transcriptional regulator